jgi:hypothetical protein
MSDGIRDKRPRRNRWQSPLTSSEGIPTLYLMQTKYRKWRVCDLCGLRILAGEEYTRWNKATFCGFLNGRPMALPTWTYALTARSVLSGNVDTRIGDGCFLIERPSTNATLLRVSSVGTCSPAFNRDVFMHVCD